MILLEPVEIMGAVLAIDRDWQGYTDDYAIQENIVKATGKKILIQLQAIYNLPDGGMFNERMGEFIQELMEEAND
ncbi:hypothetical protein LCGC14_0384800 [marine sediment metagenome]|uniref:Uncharacterized protein n=1 Tax=marine sediment metagenome TaxID=412755 RepID=A0A0F9WA41_9ZZZZ